MKSARILALEYATDSYDLILPMSKNMPGTHPIKCTRIKVYRFHPY